MYVQNYRSHTTTDFHPVYGSETWVLTKSDEAILGVFERKILRAIFGPTNNKGEWRIKYELYTLDRKSVV